MARIFLCKDTPKLKNRDTRFTRQAKERIARGIVNPDSQPTPDEQLTRLEEDLRRLKVEFDIFLNGAVKRPPYDTKGRVETLIKRLGDDRGLTYAQRYRYNSMTARYASFNQLWRRTMQNREEGRDAAAVVRATQHARNLKPTASSNFVCADARHDVKTVKELFDALVQAKRGCGEATDDLSFPRFHHLITTKTENLKERLGCDRVRFSIETVDGRVNFKAKADREES